MLKQMLKPFARAFIPFKHYRANLTGRGRHAYVIFSFFCESGFSLLPLKHGSHSQECGTDDRSRFESISMRHSPFTELLIIIIIIIIKYLYSA